MRPALLLALLPLLACHEPLARAEGGADPLIEVEVEGVRLDLETRTPVLLLEEREGDRKLPIWIGVSEARSIAAWLEGGALPRPNTHDLAGQLLKTLEGRLERVVVSKLERGVFFASMVVAHGEASKEVDARPSDAIAIALRMDAPLFVHPSVFDQAGADPEVKGQEIRAVEPERDRQLRLQRL